MKRGSRFSFKRMYLYTCKICKKKRGTRIYARRIIGICTICRKNEIDKNQIKLIETRGFSRDEE